MCLREFRKAACNEALAQGSARRKRNPADLGVGSLPFVREFLKNLVLLSAFLTPPLLAQTPLGNPCTAITARTPEAVQELINAGLDLSRKGRYDGAAECYRKALAIDPKVGSGSV